MAIIGLIPAAGQGTRLYPLPFSKELYPIGYQQIEIDGSSKLRPKVISQYLLEHMVSAGAEKVIMTLGPGKSDIMDYYGSGERHGVDIIYTYQNKPQGMPFALNLAHPWIREDDTLIFGMSDTIMEPKNIFSKLHLEFKNLKADLLLGVFTTDNPSKFGMVDFDLDSLVVKATIDKPSQTPLEYMWGCCIWNYRFSSLMNRLLEEAQITPQKKEVVFGDIINDSIKNGLKVVAVPIQKGQYIDIGTTEDLDTALKKFHL